MPTDEDLDTILLQQPQFDLDALKRRTLSRVGEASKQPTKKKHISLRGFLIAAVICALSFSVVAAAYCTTDGRILQVLGINRKPQIETAQEVSVPVEEPITAQKAEPPTQIPEQEPVDTSAELDSQIAEALQIDETQAPQMRPAVQAVEQAIEDQKVRMTVLQTLGDPSCLYIKLRFDFPETVPADKDLKFETIGVSFSNAGKYSWREVVLEQDDHSVTYLLSAALHGEKSLSGQTITVSAENYGRPHQYTENEMVQLEGEEGKSYTVVVHPNGTIDREVTEDVTSLPPEMGPPVIRSDGFTVSERTDGSKVVSYDGEHGEQLLTIYLASGFDILVDGRWEQSWTLSYDDLSQYWSGEVELFNPSLTLTDIRLSPLSWEVRFTTQELSGEELGYGLLYDSDLAVQLRHKDDSLTELPNSSNSGTYTAGSSDKTSDGMYVISTISMGSVFDQPVDISDVTAILIGGEEFPIS